MADLARICRPLHIGTTQAQRRALVLACYLGYALLVGVSIVAHDSGSVWLNAVRILLLVVSILGYVGLTLAIASNPGQARPAVLDERERGVREHAFATSYGILSALVVLATAYAAIAFSFADTVSLWLPRTWEGFEAVMWAVIILTTTLPGAIVGWSEPDMPSDESAVAMVRT